MKRRTLFGTLTLFTLAILAWGYLQYGWMFYRYHSTACKQRGEIYRARVHKLERDARERLKVGTQREDIVRFFKENGLPVDGAHVPIRKWRVR